MTDLSQSDSRSVRQQDLTEELLASGIPASVHQQLDYQPVTAEEAQSLVGHRKAGWAVQFRDTYGQPLTPPFWRLKPSNIAGGPKYLTKKGAGCRPYYSPLATSGCWQSSQDIFITEGEKKADALSHHGFNAIALSGVDAWRDRRSEQSEPLPELLQINWSRSVFVVFDSDVTVKVAVRQSLESLCKWLSSLGASPHIVQLPCELNGTKNGADDFLARYGRDEFKRLVTVARPATSKSANGCQFCWKDAPTGSHEIAVAATPVIRYSFAVRPNVAIYKWNQRCWNRLDERPQVVIIDQLHHWLDGMGWLPDRSTSKMTAIANDVMARIKRRRWDPEDKIAFVNGTVDVASGILTPAFDRSNCLTFSFPFNYDPDAGCQRWLSFLDETFQGDQQLVHLLRAAIKWTVMPKPDAAFKWELFFDVLGPRQCGKGTISEVLKSLVGRQGFAIARSSTFKDRTSLAGMVGKKLALDQDAAGHLSDVGIFNSIVSNEHVEVKLLYQNPTDARLGVVIWRFFNDSPTAAGGGQEGMGRRNVTFRINKPARRPDRSLKHQLHSELAGIFTWAWSMSEADMDQAFSTRGEIDSVAIASVEAQLDANPPLRFLIETYPTGAKTTGKAIYKEYQDWCDANGHKALANNKFAKEIKKVQGLVYWQRNSAGSEYQIGNCAAFDWPTHFGFGSAPDVSAGFNHASVHGFEDDPTPRDPLQRREPHETVQGMQGLPLKVFKGKDEKEERYIEKSAPPTLHTLHSQAELDVMPAVVGSGYDVCAADGDDPHWAPRAVNK